MQLLQECQIWPFSVVLSQNVDESVVEYCLDGRSQDDQRQVEGGVSSLELCYDVVYTDIMACLELRESTDLHNLLDVFCSE